MGQSQTKTDNNSDYSNALKDDMITVNFIQLKKYPTSTISPEQLNMLLGLSIPRYSIVEGTEYPYLFCVGNQIGIEEIIKSYGYEIGYRTRQKVYKNEFNAFHKTCFAYGGTDYYKLELVR